MFRFFKKIYHFELVQSENIQSEEIDSTEKLINYVIGVNNHLINYDDTGWLYVKKLVETKNGSKVLFAMKIDLPIYQDNSYFDELLEPFYTKKALPFEDYVPQSIIKETPEIPNELSELEKKGKSLLSANENEDSSLNPEFDQLPEGETNKDSREIIKEVDNEQTIIEELKEKLRQKEEELEAMEKSNKVETIEEELKKQQDTSIFDEIEKKEFSFQVDQKNIYPGLSLDSDVVATDTKKLSPLSESISDVSDVLNLVREGFSTRLTLFVEEETQKINTEIKELDKRHLIKDELTKQSALTKQKSIDSEIAAINNERQLQLMEEEKRHENALAEIERTYQAMKLSKEAEITKTFDDKLVSDIENEYNLQTEQLSRILQGKKDELAMKQNKMNEGLKKDFTQVVNEFNKAHLQVIEDMERKSIGKEPIDFFAHKKLAN